MRRRLFEVIADHGLNPPMYYMLRQAQDTASMREVADRMCLDASTVTGIADRLEARSLVERRQSDDDRRVKELTLTPMGESVCRQIEQRLSLEPIFPELSDGDVSDLVRILGRLATE